jgi:diguanylate cyclase (GGDEF)-like protein
LGAADARREELAKEWLIGAIREAPLSELGELPLDWAASQLPELVTDILVAICEGPTPVLGSHARERSRSIGVHRPGLTPTALAAEIARLQGEIARVVMRELDGESSEVMATAVARLASVFGAVSGEAHEALGGRLAPEDEFVYGLKRPEMMHRRLRHLVEAHRRHGHPFAITLFDIEGPGADRVDIVARELRQSIRSIDETYRLEENELCVLAPYEDASDGARMAERLSNRLAELEQADGWQITISAGVAACPEHGFDPDKLLASADTAMWRARATGRPVAVAALPNT